MYLSLEFPGGWKAGESRMMDTALWGVGDPADGTQASLPSSVLTSFLPGSGFSSRWQPQPALSPPLPRPPGLRLGPLLPEGQVICLCEEGWVWVEFRVRSSGALPAPAISITWPFQLLTGPLPLTLSLSPVAMKEALHFGIRQTWFKFRPCHFLAV